MELAFTPLRILALILLLGLFALLGGPALAALPPRASSRIVLLFLIGAVASTVVNHHVGTIDRTNLRWLYVVGGVCQMAGSLLWLVSMG